MAFPYALVMQGISLLGSLISSPKSDPSALALFEILHQLQNVNEGLKQLNSTMIEANKLLKALPAELAIFEQQYNSSVVSEGFSDIIRKIDQDVGPIKNLASIHIEVTQSYISLGDSFNTMEEIIKTLQDKPFSLLPLSYPLIRLLTDLIRSAEFSLLPDLLYEYANSDSTQVEGEVIFSPGIEINEFVGTLEDILDFIEKTVLGENGAYSRFEDQLFNEIGRFAESDGQKSFRKSTLEDYVSFSVETAGLRGAFGIALIAPINVYRTTIIKSFISVNLNSLEVKYEQGVTYTDDQPKRKNDVNHVLSVYRSNPHHTNPLIENKATELGPLMKPDDPYRPFREYINERQSAEVDAMKSEAANYSPFGLDRISFDDRTVMTIELIQVAIFMRNFHDLLEFMAADISSKLGEFRTLQQ